MRNAIVLAGARSQDCCIDIIVAQALCQCVMQDAATSPSSASGTAYACFSKGKDLPS